MNSPSGCVSGARDGLAVPHRSGPGVKKVVNGQDHTDSDITMTVILTDDLGNSQYLEDFEHLENDEHFEPVEALKNSQDIKTSENFKASENPRGSEDLKDGENLQYHGDREHENESDDWSMESSQYNWPVALSVECNHQIRIKLIHPHAREIHLELGWTELTKVALVSMLTCFLVDMIVIFHLTHGNGGA